MLEEIKLLTFHLSIFLPSLKRIIIVVSTRYLSTISSIDHHTFGGNNARQCASPEIVHTGEFVGDLEYKEEVMRVLGADFWLMHVRFFS